MQRYDVEPTLYKRHVPAGQTVQSEDRSGAGEGVCGGGGWGEGYDASNLFLCCGSYVRLA